MSDVFFPISNIYFKFIKYLSTFHRSNFLLVETELLLKKTLKNACVQNKTDVLGYVGKIPMKTADNLATKKWLWSSIFGACVSAFVLESLWTL